MRHLTTIVLQKDLKILLRISGYPRRTDSYTASFGADGRSIKLLNRDV